MSNFKVQEMKNRLISEIKKHILIFALGIAYYLWIVFTDIYIPCIFNKITGLKCPGCGITHMIMAIARFDFANAFLANPLLFIALPIMLAIYIRNRSYYIRTGNTSNRGMIIKILEYTMLVLTLAFWVARNI